MANKVLPLIIMLLTILTTNTYAQKVQISGRVVDHTSQPISGCNVMLYNKQNNTLIEGLISDINGSFTIQVNEKGTTLLEISLLGFEKNISQIEVKNENIQLGDIQLNESAIELSAVTITATKDEIEFSPGKATVNLSSALLQSRSNIFEVLRIMPGVLIREDGTIALNGQSGTQIVINGKATYLSGDNLINLLRSMPAASVKKIELITHPSAKYDAAGNAGIINLQTDRHFFTGTTLSIHNRYTQGKYAMGDMGFNFAYRKNKLCLFADYSFYTGNNYNDLKIEREDVEPLTQKPLDRWMYQDAYRRWNYNSHYYRMGADFDISPKTYVGIYTTGFMMDRKQKGTIHSQTIASAQKTNTLETKNQNNKYPRSYSAGINMAYKPNERIEWNNYLDIVFHEQPEKLYQNSHYYDIVVGKSTQDTLQGNMDGNIQIYAAESNLVFQLTENYQLNAGVKASKVTVENFADYHNRLNNTWIPDTLLTKQFTYDENMNAAYLQFQAKFTDKLTMQAGIRLENTNVKGTVDTIHNIV